MVLVVEDHADTQHVLVRIVRTLGYDAESVGSAEEALEFFEQRQPTIVLSDFKLPGMDGLKLFRQIRRHPAWRGIRFIIVSCYGPVEEMCLSAGVDGFVDKCHLNIETLRDHLEDSAPEGSR